MIEIKVDSSDAFKTYIMTVKGHAGMAPYGQDIVCAGVSSLVQTLALYADHVEMRPGDVFLSGKGAEQYEAFLVIMNGLKGVADAYPEAVNISD